MPGERDTIVAIASPPGHAERAILRASGRSAAEFVRATTGLDAHALGARSWIPIEFDDAVGTQPGMLAWMRGPRSLTGEDVAEFHLPGHPELALAALRRLIALGARAAGPGEFTRRAFLAGKLDLSRAEGVLLLVAAQDDAERRAASALLFGGLARGVHAAREELLELRALSEASLDFDPAETGHVPREELLRGFARAEDRLSAAERDERARPGEVGLPRVVLAGRPNAGKSALFNALVGRAAAIESPLSGTTRDALVARVELGLLVLLVDTAGDEAARDDVERAAQEQGDVERRAAELVLWVVDASDPRAAPPTDLAGTAPVLVVWNKLDRAGAGPRVEAVPLTPRFLGSAAVSARTGEGLDALRARVGTLLAERRPGLSRELSARHLAALGTAREELALARSGLDGELALELVAEHLRAAGAALDQIDGATTSEDVLDRIFARFCLGK